MIKRFIFDDNDNLAIQHGDGPLEIPQLSDYIEVITNGDNGFLAHAEAAREIGVTPQSFSNWSRDRSHPSDDHMISIARLAGANPKTALMHLNIWRSGEVSRSVYQDLLKIVAVLLITTTFSTSTFHEQMNMEVTKAVYYGK